MAEPARTAAEDKKGSSDNGNRVTVYLLITCIVAATGGLLFGYDLGVSGGVTSMDSFQKKFFPDVYRKAAVVKQTDYCKFNSQILTLFTSSLYVAGLVSSLGASHVTRVFGRRYSMMVGSFTFLAGSVLNGAAVNVYMLILGRILLGFGVGFANQAIPIYLSEMAPPRFRGAFNVGFQLFIGIGVLTANLINYATDKIKGGWGWRLSLSLAAIPATIMAVATFTLPDTPSSLLQRGPDLRPQVISLLQRLRGTQNVQEELTTIIMALQRRNENAVRSVVLERRYRPQLIVALSVQVFSQLAGINIIAFYGPVLLKTVGFGSNASLMSAVILGVVNLVSIVVSIAAVDFFGRRKLLIQGCLQMLICQIGIAVILATKAKEGPGGLPKGYAEILVALLCLFSAGFGWSWGPLSWLIPSEIFPLEVRSAGQSLSVAAQFLMTFVLAQIFSILLCRLKYAIFLFYGAWVSVMSVWVWLFLPETKNVAMDEHMEKLWSNHWFWRTVGVSERHSVSPSADVLLSSSPIAR